MQLTNRNSSKWIVHCLFIIPISPVASFAFSSRLLHQQPQLLLQVLARKESTALLQQDLLSSSSSSASPESTLRWGTTVAAAVSFSANSSFSSSSASRLRRRQKDAVFSYTYNNILNFRHHRQKELREREQLFLEQQQQQQQLQWGKPAVSPQWILGFLFSLGVLYALASGYHSTPTVDATTMLSSSSIGGTGSTTSDATLFVFPVERLEGLADSIIGAAFPMTASDVVSVTLGEGVAGLMGGLVSGALSTTMQQMSQQQQQKRQLQRQQQQQLQLQEQPRSWLGIKSALQPSSATGVRSISTSSSSSQSSVVNTGDATIPALSKMNTVVKGSEVVASGDYFLTRAAVIPLLKATGLPPGVATLAAAVVAAVPYELVKLGTRRREQQLEEERKMQELLEEKLAQDKRKLPFLSLFTPKPAASVDPESLKPLQIEMKMDFVEVFADLTKWLEYAVLTEQLGGSLAWSAFASSFPFVESFIFGALANLSSQVYADILYAFSGFGGEEKQKEVLSRSLSEWSALYLSSCVTGATLFGVYEAAQIPAKFLTATLFSGGVEGCVGSNDYDLCIESFLFHNPPPGPSAEAQIRALATTAVSIWNHLELDSVFFSGN